MLPFAPVMVEAVRESAGQGGYTEAEFAPAAEEACHARAARHGRVEIIQVDPQGAGAVRVYGTIDRFGGSAGRSFACVFRRNGSIGYFKVSKSPGTAS
jgi:hypothetical protein